MLSVPLFLMFCTFHLLWRWASAGLGLVLGVLAGLAAAACAHGVRGCAFGRKMQQTEGELSSESRALPGTVPLLLPLSLSRAHGWMCNTAYQCHGPLSAQNLLG